MHLITGILLISVKEKVGENLPAPEKGRFRAKSYLEKVQWTGSSILKIGGLNLYILRFKFVYF